MFSPRYIQKRRRFLSCLLKPLGGLALSMLGLSLVFHALGMGLVWFAFWLALEGAARNLYRPIAEQERIGPLVVVYPKPAKLEGLADHLWPGEALKLANTAHAAGLLVGSAFCICVLHSGWAWSAGIMTGLGLYGLIYLLAALVVQSAPADSDPQKTRTGKELQEIKTACVQSR